MAAPRVLRFAKAALASKIRGVTSFLTYLPAVSKLQSASSPMNVKVSVHCRSVR